MGPASFMWREHDAFMSGSLKKAIHYRKRRPGFFPGHSGIPDRIGL